MNTELIRAIQNVADAQNAIATQLGRIGDQITPSEDQTKYPGTGVDFLASAIADAVPNTADALDRIADAFEKKD